MTEIQYRTIDKSAWGDGPWQSEPDKIQYTDAATGLPCLAKRNPRSGNWCGYVGVPKGHPFFGLGYNERAQKCDDEYCYEHTPEALLEVHGGITYSDECQKGPEAIAICHIPEPGQSDHVWWFGWDAAHAGDWSPGYDHTPVLTGDVYRDLNYIRNQNAHLAQQLAEIALTTKSAPTSTVGAE